MPEDLYEDEGATDFEAVPAEAAPEEKSTETKTALIDSAICPGMKVGDEFVVKTKKVLDKEYLVSYAPKPEEDEETSEEAPADEEMPEGSMSSMMY
jgi:hypothetical protein